MNIYGGMKQIWILKNKMKNMLLHIPYTKSNYKNQCVRENDNDNNGYGGVGGNSSNSSSSNGNGNDSGTITLHRCICGNSLTTLFNLFRCYPVVWYRNAIFDCFYIGVALGETSFGNLFHIESFIERFECITSIDRSHTMQYMCVGCAIVYIQTQTHRVNEWRGKCIFGLCWLLSFRKDSYKTYNTVKIYSIFELMTSNDMHIYTYISNGYCAFTSSSMQSIFRWTTC